MALFIFVFTSAIADDSFVDNDDIELLMSSKPLPIDPMLPYLTCKKLGRYALQTIRQMNNIIVV